MPSRENQTQFQAIAMGMLGFGVVLLTTGAGRLGPVALESSRPGHTATSCVAEWSAPTSVALSEPAASPRHYSMAVDSLDRWYVVGNDLRRLDTLPAEPGNLILITESGTVYRSPDDALWYLSPLVRTTAAGVLTVVWGEPPPGPAAERRWFDSQSVASLRYATWRLSEGWSQVDAVSSLRTSRLSWHRSSRGGDLDADGRLHVVALDSGEPAGLLWARLSEEGDQVRRLPAVRGGYSDLAIMDGTLHTVYTAPSPEPGRVAGNGLYYRGLLDGEHWTSPFQLGHEPVAEAQIRDASIVTDGETLHVLWTAQWGERATAVHVHSSDEGATWSQPSALRLPSHFVNPRVAVGPCGKVHFLYLIREDDAHTLAHATWSGGWQSTEVLFPEWNVIDLALARGPRKLHLALTARPSSNAPEERPTFLHSELESE